jgi:eukaryotic-like serine/threonine-protein kinase
MADEIEVDLVGTTTGGYRILSRLGVGTMGHVYEAEDAAGRRVALKVLRKQHQKEFAPRFLREGKTLALLSHPNIVQLADMGQLEDGALFLATELIAGASLRATMNGPIEAKRALLIVRQVLDALDAAHSLGVVHRDVKPENVMLADDGSDVVKVLDFGVAKLLADTIAGLGEANLTSVGFSVFGSAHYIAPESVTGQKIDARLDLYSVGAMLYEMLTGRPPFDDEDPTALLRMHAFEPAPTLAKGAPGLSLSRELEDLVARALVKDPQERFGSAIEMMAAVDVAIASVAALPPPPPVARFQVPDPPHIRHRKSRLPQRRKLLIGAAIAVALIVSVALLFGTRHGAESSTASGDELATRAAGLVTAGRHEEAVAMIERELEKASTTEHSKSYLVLGHARFALGRRLDALAAYERALRASAQLGKDPALRANLTSNLDTTDSLTVLLSLDLLASLSPPAIDALAMYASTGKLADARRRAVMIAERDGIVKQVDLVASMILDLQQSSACDARKLSIAKLAATGDRRAIPALRRVRAVKCVEREATEALARLEGGPR